MADLAQFVSTLGREILTAENFHALLPGVVERVGEVFDAHFAGCYLSKQGQHQEVRWDRELTGGARPFSAKPWLEDIGPTGVRVRVIDNEGSQAALASVSLGGEDALHLVVARDQLQDEATEGLSAVATTLALGASRSDLQREAVYDSCTGLYNRRYMDVALSSELQRAQRFRVAMTLMILDVDYFKSINDRFGHLVGDRVLNETGRILLESVRACDMVFRYGGDEFVLLLPATNLGGAKRVAGRIQERVHSLRVTGRTVSTTKKQNRRAARVTMSGGAAAATAKSTPHSLLSAADQRLYKAKRAGRDHIVFPARKVAELSAQLNLLATPSSPKEAMGTIGGPETN